MTEKTCEPGTILVVDDNRLDRTLLAEGLRSKGYHVEAVGDGETALELARTCVIDLLLLDVVMPDTDGYAVCQELHDDPRTESIPVILVSSLEDTEDVLRAFEVGGVDYVKKPVQLNEVVARAETHLSLRRLRRELSEANAELTRHNRELERRNEELDAFAHTVAHDLKGPLASVKGYADVLLADGLDLTAEEHAQFSGYVVNGARKMKDIVDSLLLLSKVRATAPLMGPFDMASVVAEALARVHHICEEVDGAIEVPHEWPRAVGHAAWVEEVWTNYLSNALRYGGTPPQVSLGADREADRVRFWVRDNGQGLTPEQQEKLFVPFERLGSRRYDSHGLGLSIVRRIVLRLGGEAGCDSEVGRGSTFWFTLRPG